MGPLFLVEMPGSDPVTNFDVVFLVFFFFHLHPVLVRSLEELFNLVLYRILGK